eukprot:3174983-Amphidinium_carterae.1
MSRNAGTRPKLVDISRFWHAQLTTAPVSNASMRASVPTQAVSQELGCTEVLEQSMATVHHKPILSDTSEAEPSLVSLPPFLDACAVLLGVNA